LSGFVRGLTWRGRDVMQDFAVMPLMAALFLRAKMHLFLQQ